MAYGTVEQTQSYPFEAGNAENLPQGIETEIAKTLTYGKSSRILRTARDNSMCTRLWLCSGISVVSSNKTTEGNRQLRQDGPLDSRMDTKLFSPFCFY